MDSSACLCLRTSIAITSTVIAMTTATEITPPTIAIVLSVWVSVGGISSLSHSRPSNYSTVIGWQVLSSDLRTPCTTRLACPEVTHSSIASMMSELDALAVPLNLAWYVTSSGWDRHWNSPAMMCWEVNPQSQSSSISSSNLSCMSCSLPSESSNYT